MARKFPEIVQLRLPSGLSAKIDRAASAEGSSRADFLRRLLVKNMKPRAQRLRTGHANSKLDNRISRE
jgi:hypothetical protein